MQPVPALAIEATLAAESYENRENRCTACLDLLPAGLKSNGAERREEENCNLSATALGGNGGEIATIRA